jgi:hypothetical protein
VDELSKQLITETRTPLAMKSGRPARYDYEYERNGTANLFMMFAPLGGWRHVKVTDRDTAVDYADVLKELSDIRFPDAEKIILVQDNLNTHTPASLYEAFPEEARRLVQRFEWHYTPKMAAGSTWHSPNWPFSPPSASTAGCPTNGSSRARLLPWEVNRNRKHTKANWRFTTENARVKLKNLYPSF